MKIALSLAVFIVIVWLAFGLFIYSQWSWRGIGTFGDTYGVLNALFSGLAIGGVIVAIMMQKQELGYQREELEATRTELKRSADAQIASEQALTKQFTMLQLTAQVSAYSSLIDNIRGRIDDGARGDALTEANSQIAGYDSKLRGVLDKIEEAG